MSILPNGSQRFCTPQDVDVWLLAAQEQRARLHFHAVLPLESDQRQEAFTAMSDLLLEAFEEIRVVSESVREESQSVRSTSVALRADSARLQDRGRLLVEGMAKFIPPPPETLREAESQFLATFRGGRKPETP